MSASPAGPALLETAADVRAVQTPYVLLALIGLGGFPLFVEPIPRQHRGVLARSCSRWRSTARSATFAV